VLSGGNLTNKVINLKNILFFSVFVICVVQVRHCFSFKEEMLEWEPGGSRFVQGGGGQIGRIGELLQIPVFISAYFKFWIVATHSTVAFLLLLLCP
jgi:hypothetical protein